MALGRHRGDAYGCAAWLDRGRLRRDQPRHARGLAPSVCRPHEGLAHLARGGNPHAPRPRGFGALAVPAFQCPFVHECHRIPSRLIGQHGRLQFWRCQHSKVLCRTRLERPYRPTTSSGSRVLLRQYGAPCARVVSPPYGRQSNSNRRKHLAVHEWLGAFARAHGALLTQCQGADQRRHGLAQNFNQRECLRPRARGQCFGFVHALIEKV